MSRITTIPLTGTTDVSLANLLRSIVDEIERADDSTELANTYAPTSGRFAETNDGTIYIGDGSSWNAVGSTVGLQTAVALRRQSAKTTNTTVSEQGAVIPVDTSGGTVTITLASAAVEDGATVVVNDEGGNAGTNAITVNTEGSENIDGATSQSISANYGELRLYSDGTNWYSY